MIQPYVRIERVRQRGEVFHIPAKSLLTISTWICGLRLWVEVGIVR